MPVRPPRPSHGCSPRQRGPCRDTPDREMAAGSYSVSISMSFEDYLAAVRSAQEPLVAHFAQPAAAVAAAAAGAAHFRQYLRTQGVPFEGVRHGRAFTAPEIAEEAHVPGRCLAKPVCPPLSPGRPRGPSCTSADVKRRRASCCLHPYLYNNNLSSDAQRSPAQRAVSVASGPLPLLKWLEGRAAARVVLALAHRVLDVCR